MSTLTGKKKFKIPQQAILGPVIIVVFVALVMQANWTRRNQRLFRGMMSGLERIACQYCRGTGTIMDKDGSDQMTAHYCPVCYGVGFRFIRRLDENDKLCPACGGLGRLQDPDTGQFRTCNRCDGRGLIQVLPGDHR